MEGLILAMSVGLRIFNYVRSGLGSRTWRKLLLHSIRRSLGMPMLARLSTKVQIAPHAKESSMASLENMSILFGQRYECPFCGGR
jgi:hypothetical protein